MDKNKILLEFQEYYKFDVDGYISELPPDVKKLSDSSIAVYWYTMYKQLKREVEFAKKLREGDK